MRTSWLLKGGIQEYFGSHYTNTPMQYTALFHDCKNVNFQMKNFIIFSQNIWLWVHVRTASVRRKLLKI